MNPRNMRGLILIALLLLVVGWIAISSVSKIEAEVDITPTIIVSDRNFLPYIRGLVQGPTTTATLPPATITPWATMTHTPTATATPTATNTPDHAETSTSTPTATNTVPAPQLPAPSIYDIDNGDKDGNFTVAWTAVAGAEYYKLKQNYNDTTWDTAYEGPALSINRSNMAPGEYCYRVRAFNSGGNSEWSADKCTTVMGEPEPEFLCEFETLYEGPRYGSDIELLHDGRLLIVGGTNVVNESASGYIFDPVTRKFKYIDFPQIIADAAVLADGRVRIGVTDIENEDFYSIIYDPTNDEITTWDSYRGGVGLYRVLWNGSLLAVGGGSGSYSYPPYYAPIKEFEFDYSYSNSPRHQLSFVVPQDSNRTMFANGTTGEIVSLSFGEPRTKIAFDYTSTFWPIMDSGSTLSFDMGKLYTSGGLIPDYWGINHAAKDVYELDLEDYQIRQVTDLLIERFRHVMIGLSDGNLIVLGGTNGELVSLKDIELYVPDHNKWYEAGSINIERQYPQAIQLLNGEIFVYSGETEPGPGYSYYADRNR